MILHAGPGQYHMRSCAELGIGLRGCMFIKLLEYTGKSTLKITEEIGDDFLMFWQTVSWCLRRPYNFRMIFQQMEAIGFNSLPVVLIMALFTGMVLAIQP